MNAKNPASTKPKGKDRGIPAFTCNAWANALRVEFRTLAKRLQKAGFMDATTEKNHRFSAHAVFTSLHGDEDEQRLRNLKLDADEKERKEKVAAGQLVAWESVQQILNQRLVQPIQRALDNCPVEAQEWRDKVLLPILRTELKPEVNP